MMLLPLLTLLAACEKESVQDGVDCQDLIVALLTRDEASVRSQLDSYAADLQPTPTASDGLGHAQNLDKVVDRLNGACSQLTASVSCYACIYTLPAQSEILISLDSANVVVERVIDLFTPENDLLEFAGMH